MTHSAWIIRVGRDVTLRAMGFLQVLRPEDRIALTNAGRSRGYRRGATIIVQGDHSDTVFVLTRRWVKITHDTSSGREIVLSVLGPGDVLGDWEAIDPAIGPRLAGTVALEPPTAGRRLDYGLTCRLYPGPHGLRGSPPEERVLAALGPRGRANAGATRREGSQDAGKRPIPATPSLRRHRRVPEREQ